MTNRPRISTQAELRLADERHRLQSAETQLAQEAAGRRAAEARAGEAAAALAQTRALLGEAELKARRASEELARSAATLRKSDEALRQVRSDAERSVLDAQVRAREEAESRGKAAAQAAFRRGTSVIIPTHFRTHGNPCRENGWDW